MEKTVKNSITKFPNGNISKSFHFRRNNMYEKIKDWVLSNRFFVGLGIGAILFLAGYMFSRASLSDNGNRANDTGTKLQQSVSDQQAISSGIAGSQGTADAIGSSIKRSQAANSRVAEAVDRAGSLVEESRKLTERNLEIIAAIRARGPAGDRTEN